MQYSFYSGLVLIWALQFIFPSFGIVVPKDNNYVQIPTDGNDIKVEIKNVNDTRAFIAPWNYCQENRDKWDYVDSFETLGNDSIPCKLFSCELL